MAPGCSTASDVMSDEVVVDELTVAAADIRAGGLLELACTRGRHTSVTLEKTPPVASWQNFAKCTILGHKTPILIDI